MASGQSSRRTSAPVKYDNTGKPTKQGVKSDNTGKSINSKSPPKSPPKPTPNEQILEKMRENAPKPPSSTAQVPQGGAALPTKGNSANAGLAKSLIKKGVGRLVPGVGLILTAVEVARYLNSGETAANKPVKSRGQMGRPPKEKESDSSQKRAERITRKEPFDIKELDTELRMKEDLKNPRYVKPAPGSQLKNEGPASSEPPVPRNRPSTVDTQSKKPLVKRIMEALGDNRTMEQATRDREMTAEMERERMGQKKGGMGQKKKDSVKKAYGGMGQKKKDSVKKAYGGMVKKKQGGSANKVNMKAGFTRRGCSKG
jgi:hypothetical protein